jgi:hypothetical protein
MGFLDGYGATSEPFDTRTASIVAKLTSLESFFPG